MNSSIRRGTTKNPKGVPINHAPFLDSVLAQLEVDYPLAPPADNVVLQGGPLFHILGRPSVSAPCACRTPFAVGFVLPPARSKLGGRVPGPLLVARSST